MNSDHRPVVAIFECSDQTFEQNGNYHNHRPKVSRVNLNTSENAPSIERLIDIDNPFKVEVYQHSPRSTYEQSWEDW